MSEPALITPMDDLPDDVPTLKAQLREAQRLNFMMCIAYAHLHETHQDLMRRAWGKRSQKLNTVLKNSGQAGAETQTEAPAANATANSAADQPNTKGKGRKKGGGGRRAPPKHLPIVREVIDLPEDQKAGLKWIRDEITSQLGYRRSQFFLRQIVRPVYAHPEREHAPKVMPLPPQVIPQAGVDVSFIVRCVLGKYLDYCPHYRQAQIDARDGVLVPRQARYRYTMAVATLLLSIRWGIKQLLLQSGYIKIDETFADLLDPDRGGRARTCFLWGYMNPQLKACVVEFSINRSGVVLDEFFNDPNWSGEMDLHSDGAGMYTSFVKKHPGVRHYECLMHVRQRLVRALQSHHREALPLLDLIGELYGIEKQADQLGFTDEQRGFWRHRFAKPILKQLQKRLLKLRADRTVFGAMRKAVRYATNGGHAEGRWRRVAGYARAGRGHISIDQNSVERLWRPVKINLRNCLFIGHPAAGWVSAVLYSIIGNCKLLEIDAEAYLNWVLPQLAARREEKSQALACKGLLPQDFAKLKEKEKQEQAAALMSAAQASKPSQCAARPGEPCRSTRLAKPSINDAADAHSGAPRQTLDPPH